MIYQQLISNIQKDVATESIKKLIIDIKIRGYTRAISKFKEPIKLIQKELFK